MDKEVGRKRAHKPKKLMTSESEVLKSTSLKKRAFDERSKAPPSFRASKRRNVGNTPRKVPSPSKVTWYYLPRVVIPIVSPPEVTINRELDICEMRTKNMQNSNGALEKLKRKKA